MFVVLYAFRELYEYKQTPMHGDVIIYFKLKVIMDIWCPLQLYNYPERLLALQQEALLHTVTETILSLWLGFETGGSAA